MFKTALYIVCTFVAAFGLSGINFNGLFKKDKLIEARVLIVVLSVALGYLFANFIWDFVNLTSIIK